MGKYSIIIKNGLVFDGKGNEPKEVNIGIAGDEIKKIGDLKNDLAQEIIDAEGKYVCPGFIDLTNHSDTKWTLFSHPSQESLLQQGITTILGGNCGSSLAPFTGESSIEEIGRWMDTSEININWRTIGEFLSELDKRRLGVNFGTLVGFNTLQRAILEKEVRVPNDEELKEMKLLLEKSLKEGAFGFSTNLGIGSARTLMDEWLKDLFKIAKDFGVMTAHHLEDEGENILPSISRLISIARHSGAKLHFTHFKVLGKNSWGFFDDAIEMLKNARAENIEATCDFFPYTRTGSSLITLLPAWFKKLPTEEAITIICPDSKDRRREDILDYLRKLTLHYDKIIIASAVKEFGIVGKTIWQLSESSGISGEETVLNLLRANELRVSIFNEVIHPENIEKIAAMDFAAVASDGVGYELLDDNALPQATKDLPHPRSFGAFPRAIKMLAKDKKILSWKSIIRKMTGLPAEIIGLKDRGIIIEGAKADIVVFNPEEISDEATYERPFAYSIGMEKVLVNGEIVLSSGKFLGKFAGQVLSRK